MIDDFGTVAMQWSVIRSSRLGEWPVTAKSENLLMVGIEPALIRLQARHPIYLVNKNIFQKLGTQGLLEERP